VEAALSPRSEEHRANLHRRYAEPAEPIDKPEPDAWAKDYRSPGQRDRDRVLYSGALQRLAHVTQVTAPESGLTFHNRLSHSLKVAQIGRRNAERLRALADAGEITGAAADLVLSLDPDSIEASCLAHDLGHPPFGHIAEEVLQEEAGEYIDDSFEGNAQSFRIVTRLAQRASAGGLNFTRQTLDGLLKYPWRHLTQDPLGGKRERKWGYYDVDKEFYDFARQYSPPETVDELPEKSLEAHLTEWADDLTYAVHDVDDFFRAGLIPLDRLGDPKTDDFKRLRELLEEAKSADPKSFPSEPIDDLLGAVQLVAEGTGPTGAYRHTNSSRRDMRRFGSELITRYFSALRINDDPDDNDIKLTIPDDVEREVTALKLLVRVYVIRRPGLAVVQHGQQRVIRELFGFYMKASHADPARGGDRRLFPPGARQALEEGPNEDAPRARVVVDLLSGLTEDAAIQLHRRLTGGWAAPTLDATAEIG
jgi:dGTPase